MSRMKNSGIPWIGEIPNDWKSFRLKDYYLFEKGKNAAVYTQEYIGQHNGSFPVYSGQTENNGVMGLIDTYDYSVDECLFTTTVGAKAMTPRIMSGKFSLSQNCLIMRRKKECSNHFVYYALVSLFDYEKAHIPTYMQPSLRVSDLNKYFLVAPTMNEQERIASFLDIECARIDAVMEQTRASIEEYKKLKQSIITEAVTKGIRPNRPMKDSGIEWIGQIPNNWNIEKGKRIFQKLERPVLDDDGVITCFRDGEVTLRSKRREEGFTFSLQEIGYQGIEVGDLVVHGMDGFAGAIGVSDSRGKGTPVLNVLDSQQDKRYMMYYLRSMAFNGVFIALATGIRVRTCDTNWNKLKELPYPLPSIEEQNEIAEHIDKKNAEIDALISKKEKFLAEIESYKKSMIFEYVTGKREVAVK